MIDMVTYKGQLSRYKIGMGSYRYNKFTKVTDSNKYEQLKDALYIKELLYRLYYASK